MNIIELKQDEFFKLPDTWQFWKGEFAIDEHLNKCYHSKVRYVGHPREEFDGYKLFYKCDPEFFEGQFPNYGKTDSMIINIRYYLIGDMRIFFDSVDDDFWCDIYPKEIIPIETILEKYNEFPKMDYENFLEFFKGEFE